MTTTDDAYLAIDIATGAGEALMALRTAVDEGRGPSDEALRDLGDRAAQAAIAKALADARPDDAVLSEEAVDDARRSEADRVWIIDPLDGTREFAERTADGAWRDDFAVHVALWVRGAGLTVGAVGLPGRGIIHSTLVPPSVDPHSARDVLAGDRPLRVAVSRTRPPDLVACLAARPDVELVPMGSMGCKTMAVAEGVVDAYVHAGGQYEWDSAAPVVVATAAGLLATRLDGSVLEYNRPDPWLPDIVIGHPALAAHLRGLIEWGEADLGARTA